MNRVANRALFVLILAFLLVAGSVVFVVDYAKGASNWVAKPGSPYVYNYEKEEEEVKTKLSIGVVTDRDGKILLDMRDGLDYSNLADIRTAILHWVGDRPGNIQPAHLNYYYELMSGYDLFNGAYHYGDTTGHMRMTLDADIQTAAWKALDGRVGTVAVYNYKTGEILCAVSTPTFDPDNAPDIDSENPGEYEGVYVNNFVRGKYIPGSIFKIVTLAAALECIPDIQEQTFSCTGSMDMQGGDVTCSKKDGHGEQTLKEAFCNSCNCAFAQITLQVGRDRMNEYVEKFGLKDNLSFDGFSTRSCTYNTEGTSDEQFAWSGIGQYQDEINPCVFLRFVGAIANGGIPMDPHVVISTEFGTDLTYEVEQSTGERIMSEKTAKILSEYMANNVESKYKVAHGAENFAGLNVCAKSGTGEVGGGKKPNAMFVGFVEDPDLPLAFIICVKDAGFGANECLPIQKQVLEACKTALD